MARRSPLAWSFTSPLASILSRISPISDLNEAPGFGQRAEVDEAAGRPPDGAARLFDRVEEVRQAEQPDGLEGASFDGQRRQRGIDVGRRLEGEEAAVGQEAHALGGRPEPLRDPPGVGLRPQRRQPIAAEGRRGETAHRLDNPVKFQRVLRSSLHIGVGDLAEEGRTARPSASRFSGGNLLHYHGRQANSQWNIGPRWPSVKALPGRVGRYFSAFGARPRGLSAGRSTRAGHGRGRRDAAASRRSQPRPV